jgi:hypothetical protein
MLAKAHSLLRFCCVLLSLRLPQGSHDAGGGIDWKVSAQRSPPARPRPTWSVGRSLRQAPNPLMFVSLAAKGCQGTSNSVVSCIFATKSALEG